MPDKFVGCTSTQFISNSPEANKKRILNPMSLNLFHPTLQSWFEKNFDQPTQVQTQSWDSIQKGQHTLLAAPTGSGKTLAAFLSAIDSLIKEGLECGLEDETRVLYISPLKALSNDIQINLQQPLQGVRDALLEHGLHNVDIRAWVRTGDTTQAERAKAIRTPPHILVTTPESIYILLTSESGRKMLSTVETVIIDEIHSIAGSKRGSHLSLSLERLEALVKEHKSDANIQRIGLSATQKPIETMAHFLIGERNQPCEIIDTGHSRKRDLAIEIPQSPLSAVMSNEIWEEIYQRLEHFSNTHNTLLIFVNTRRLTERAARHMADRIGEEHVMAHHGSMSKEKRLEAEQRLKRGDLKCLVATASLELGIDIGDIDLVVQLGSPRSISAFLQRVGRSGHAIGATPKGRIFPLSRDELVETTALVHAANNNDLDKVMIPHQPLDVLAQQLVAEVSGREWNIDALYECFSNAYPYRELSQSDFDNIIKMLSDGYSTRRGRRGAYLHFDAINLRVRPRKSARIIALTNGGAIPDQFDCDVILQPEGFRIGTVGEDFAFESLTGDIFQLGNRSYRVLKSEVGKVFVEDADGQPPNIPFWFGEAPGRSDELSKAVSDLRTTFDDLLDDSEAKAIDVAQQQYQLDHSTATQLITYLATAKAALGLLPSQTAIVFERFFDEVGDMHFVIHSPFGSRVNKAWGLALRKRFCRKFNFELQAAALEDTIVLSLSSTHSFPLEEVKRYLNSKTVRDVLIQALLDAPIFPTRWRWNATISLAVLRSRFGRRSPPYFQRSDAEDLMAVVFPDQIACLENIAGEREVPNHPLVKQTIHDCLHDFMDIDGFEALIKAIETKRISVTCCDLSSPSPLAQEVISAKPYAFLDDGEAEERRTMAIKSQLFMTTDDAASLRKLDTSAIEKVISEAWPTVRTADELHDALMVLGFIQESEAHSKNVEKDDLIAQLNWNHLFEELSDDQRAYKVTPKGQDTIWVAAERLAQFIDVIPDADFHDYESKKTPPHFLSIFDKSENALLDIIRSRLEGLGPITANALGQPLGFSQKEIDPILLQLEQEGFVIQGHYTQKNTELEWCERRLLARIHRYTITRLRREINPVSISDYMHYLFDWQGLFEKSEGVESLAQTIEQLEGVSVSASGWQDHVLPARINHFTSDMLDSLCLSGRINWLRLNVSQASSAKDKPKKSPVSHTPIALIQRRHLNQWKTLSQSPVAYNLSPYAEKVKEALISNGALFFFDIVQKTGILRTQVEDALGELVNWGLVTSDAYVGLRALITPNAKRPKFRSRGRATKTSPFDNAGRWSLLEQTQADALTTDDLEFIAWKLLNRYGVIFRKMLEREQNLPPWRDLLRVYWRLEARGEIRGGRFVNGVSGEQFALKEALKVLRKASNKEKSDQIITLSSVDPLNLVGILLPGDKIPNTPLTKISFQYGNIIPTVDGTVTLLRKR